MDYIIITYIMTTQPRTPNLGGKIRHNSLYECQFDLNSVNVKEGQKYNTDIIHHYHSVSFVHIMAIPA